MTCEIDYAGILCSETVLDYRYKPACRDEAMSLALWRSGILDTNFDNLAKRQGSKFTDVFFNSLEHASDYGFDGASGNTGISNAPERDGDCPPCNIITSGSETWAKFNRNFCISQEFFDYICLGCDSEDPAKLLLDQVGLWWAKEYQRILTLQLKALLDPNSAWADQFVYDACENGVNICGTDLGSSLSVPALTATANLGGQRLNAYDGIIMDLNQYNLLSAQGQLVACCETLEGGEDIEYDRFGGLRVVVDETGSLFDEAQGKFLNILFKNGAIAFGRGCHPKPFEEDEDPCANGGDGGVSYRFRDHFLMHPKGFCEEYVGLTGDNTISDAMVADPASYVLSSKRNCIGLAGLWTCCDGDVFVPQARIAEPVKKTVKKTVKTEESTTK